MFGFETDVPESSICTQNLSIICIQALLVFLDHLFVYVCKRRNVYKKILIKNRKYLKSHC